MKKNKKTHLKHFSQSETIALATDRLVELGNVAR